jgi:hypothetical protein
MWRLFPNAGADEKPGIFFTWPNALVNWNPSPPGQGGELTGEWLWINVVLMHYFPGVQGK